MSNRDRIKEAIEEDIIQQTGAPNYAGFTAENYDIDDDTALELLCHIAEWSDYPFNPEKLHEAVLNCTSGKPDWSIDFLDEVSKLNEDTFQCDHCEEMQYTYLGNGHEYEAGLRIELIEVAIQGAMLEVWLCQNCLPKLTGLITRGRSE